MDLSRISENIRNVRAHIPAGVTLVCVSKFQPIQAIQEAYQAGERHFGESRVQELKQKVTQLPNDIQWHFIGHLQTNKLKMVLPYVSLVQSVDSVRLLDAVNAWGAANSKVINVLLEPHVAAEETKQGFEPSEILDILEHASDYPSIRFKGLMGMATFTDELSVVEGDFAAVRSLYDDCLQSYPSLNGDFTELSIGMSDDYPIAVRYGSTMVRIGSMIFGERV